MSTELRTRALEQARPAEELATVRVERGGGTPALDLVTTLRIAWGHWRPHLGAATALLAILAVPQAYKGLFAYSQRLLIDRGLAHHDGGLLFGVLAALAIGLFASAAAVLAGDYLSARVTATILNGIRARMFRHLQRLSIAFYAETKSGDLVARFSGDLADLQKSLTTRLIDAVVAILSLAINVPIAFAVDWRLGALMLLALPAAGIGTRIFGRRAAAARYALKQEESCVASAVQEAVRAQPVAKVFGLAGWLEGRFEVLLERLRRRAVRADFLAEVVGSSSSLGVLVAQAAVLGCGVSLASRAELSVGSLVAFLAVHAVVSKDAYDLTKKVLPSLISSSGALQRIEELLAVRNAVQDAPDASPVSRFTGPLALDRVSFAYGPDLPPVLHELSLEVRPGERLALVGPSGSGKSTVLQLLLRFYDPVQGRLLLGGRDLRGFRLDSFYSHVAAVFQESFLFAGTVRENLALGNPRATQVEIEAAATAAEVHETILALPHGYDTEVGELGGRLSGGQRQRLAIARAVLRDPALLLLDEATSALDPATEAAVNATLDRICAGRMVVQVTHRLAAAASADRIAVLAHGHLVEEGAHGELLARGGLYSELWNRQHGIEVSPDARHASIDPNRLAAVPLFSALGPAACAELAGRFSTARAGAGEIVLRQGELGDRFYVVARGRLEVFTAATSGERRLAVLSDGDFFGEMALLGDTPRGASVRALEDVTLLLLSGSEFQALLQGSPAVAAEIRKVAEARRRLAGPVLPEG